MRAWRTLRVLHSVARLLLARPKIASVPGTQRQAGKDRAMCCSRSAPEPGFAKFRAGGAIVQSDCVVSVKAPARETQARKYSAEMLRIVCFPGRSCGGRNASHCQDQRLSAAHACRARTGAPNLAVTLSRDSMYTGKLRFPARAVKVYCLFRACSERCNFQAGAAKVHFLAPVLKVVISISCDFQAGADKASLY